MPSREHFFQSVLIILACLLSADVYAQSALDQAKKIQTQSSGAPRNTNTSERSSGQARGGFDTRSTAPNPVRANTAPKPSPVGQMTRTQGNNIGYKPAAPSMRTAAPPPPQNPNYRYNTQGRNVNPTGDPRIAKGFDSVRRPTSSPTPVQRSTSTSVSAPARTTTSSSTSSSSSSSRSSSTSTTTSSSKK